MARELTGILIKDKWRIDTLLGEGGVAAVYSATHRNGKRVAVKVLHPHLASIAEVRERFLREGYVANRVEHPGAVGVLDDDVTEDGLVFFVMDLLDGESLEKRLAREGRLRPADVLAITGKLLDVLAAAHAKGIVHRDVKPENVYLLRDGGQRLLDFGIARLHEQAATKNATQSGAAMGTPSYMPPEQARGRWEMVDARSDLWAVGATMFALLTGRCVHEAETVNETLLLAMSRPAPALHSVWPQAPEAIAAIVDRALAFEMGDRWPDAASMRMAVEDAARALATQPAAPAPLPAAASTRTMLMTHPTPPGRTVLASSISDRPPGAAGFLSSPRRRAITGISIGAGIGAAILAAVLVVAGGRGRPGAPAAAGSWTTPGSSNPIPTSVATAAATDSATPTASATLTPVDSVGTVAIPDPPVASATTAAPPTTAPAPAPTPLRTTTPTPTPPPSPRPTSPPTSNPLDRRH
jgi:serine/threonine-protein kinase